MKKFATLLCILVLFQTYNFASLAYKKPTDSTPTQTTGAKPSHVSPVLPRADFYTFNDVPLLFDFFSNALPAPSNLPTADSFC